MSVFFNILKIKILFYIFYWPTSTFILISSCFSSSSINTKQKFWGVPQLLCVCDFFNVICAWAHLDAIICLLIQVCSNMVEGLCWRMWWYCKLIFEAINFCSRLLLWGSIFPLLFLKKTCQVELGKLFIEFHLLTILLSCMNLYFICTLCFSCFSFD